jgi:Mg2+/Co2+ transporter CorB
MCHTPHAHVLYVKISLGRQWLSWLLNSSNFAGSNLMQICLNILFVVYGANMAWKLRDLRT